MSRSGYSDDANSFTVEVDEVQFRITGNTFRIVSHGTLLTMERDKWLQVVGAFAAAFRPELIQACKAEDANDQT